MQLPIKLVCKKNKVRRDGTSLIFIQYCQSAERRVLVNTDIAIPPAYWNMKTEWVSPNLPKGYGEVEKISELLTKKLRHAEDLVKIALQNKDICPLSFLKEKFNSKNDGVLSPKTILPTKNMDVFFHIEDYKDSKRNMVKQCSINVINEMKVHLEQVKNIGRSRSLLIHLIINSTMILSTILPMKYPSKDENK